MVGETVPLINAAVVAPDFNGEERDDKNPLAVPEASVLVLIEEKPGTVLMGEQDAEGFEVTAVL